MPNTLNKTVTKLFTQRGKMATRWPSSPTAGQDGPLRV